MCAIACLSNWLITFFLPSDVLAPVSSLSSARSDVADFLKGRLRSFGVAAIAEVD
jgi:hypothetical protein